MLTGAVSVVVVMVALAGMSVRAALTDRPPVIETSAAEAMTAVAPGGVLAPRDVPASLEGHYQAAKSHYGTFAQVPCFCGCEEMLGHRHLGDCFIRPDGQRLEAHALGCGVCLGEAQQVSDLIAADITDPDDLRAKVVAEWGDPYQSQR